MSGEMTEEMIAVIIMAILYGVTILYLLRKAFIERKKGNPASMKKLRQQFKWVGGVLFFAIVVLAILSHTNFLDYEKPIPFKQYDSITFKNFRGLEFFKKDLYGSKQFAYVYTSIDTNIEGDSIAVEAFFHPSRSFVYNSKSDSEELLRHEKYHFRITELFARKIKAQLSKMHNPETAKIESVIEKFKKDECEFQKKYDDDSFHSYVYSEQKRYEKTVDSLLDLLSLYRTPKIKIHEKH